MVEMLDYRLHGAILATEDRVQRHTQGDGHNRGPVRVHGLRLRRLGHGIDARGRR